MRIFIGNKGYHHPEDLSVEIQKRLEREGHTVTNPGPRGTYSSPWTAQRSDAIVMHPGWDIDTKSLFPPTDSDMERLHGVPVYRIVGDGYQKLDPDAVARTAFGHPYDEAWQLAKDWLPQPPILKTIPEDSRIAERIDGQLMLF